ncbi:MAG: mannitol dehydrogenase family protein [Ancrocorticia sp.]|uniref:mannitol dehydrogenase family protein n=1 Tax=Ancrocorticia sp. TaxID=2593684 RepID=UPI003F8FA2AC
MPASTSLESFLQSPLNPPYDRSSLTPGIVHFGLGNFHRAHQAMYLDRLLRDGEAADWAILGVGVMPSDTRMRDVMAAQDGLYTLVLKSHGQIEPLVIGSIAGFLFASDDPEAVLDAMTSETTRIVSLTVTEGGYNTDDATGEFKTDSPGAVRDSENPHQPSTSFGYIVEALRRRRAAGLPPFTVMSCDNLQGNGKIAHGAVVAQARMSDPELADWIDSNVSFPNSMVDRITPVTTPADVELVTREYGISDAWPVTCEPFEQWVLEDKFTLGRPPYEDAGVQLVDDVVPYELMKLRLLNASHQALAHLGRLLGMEFAHQAAADPDIQAFIRAYLEREAIPTLAPVPGVDLAAYVDELFVRFTNEVIADTLARLAQDASDRMPKFVIAALRENLAAVRSLTLGATLCAAWTLGMEGTAENGTSIEVDDQLSPELLPLVARQRDGDATAVISNERVFGSLGADTTFVREFTNALASLRENGARQTIETLL